jgi:hypothetical protein
MRLLPDMDRHFTALFGEEKPALYQRKAGGEPFAVDAIFIDQPLGVDLNEVPADGHQTQIHVRAAQVGEVAEGDLITRERDGRQFRITPPIARDDQDMIGCNAYPVDPQEGDS